MCTTDKLIHRIEDFHEVLQMEGYAIQDIDSAFIEYGGIISDVLGDDPELYYDYDELVEALQQEANAEDFVDYDKEDEEFWQLYSNACDK